MERQYFEKVNFANFGGVGGKLRLLAKDYDFEFEVSELKVGEDKKKTFVSPKTYKISRPDLYLFAKGCISPLLQEYNRIRFKLKDLEDYHVFHDSKFTTMDLICFNLVGHYELDGNGRRSRVIKLNIYKFSSWDDVKAFNKDTSVGTEFLESTFELDKSVIARGSFVYKDILALEELLSTCEDLYFRRSLSYDQFLNSLTEEKKEGNSDKKPASGGKPSTVPNTDTEIEDDDEFPF